MRIITLFIIFKNRTKQKSPERLIKIKTCPEGFEPPTFWFVAKHSIQLNYGHIKSIIILQRNFCLSRKKYFLTSLSQPTQICSLGLFAVQNPSTPFHNLLFTNCFIPADFSPGRRYVRSAHSSLAKIRKNQIAIPLRSQELALRKFHSGSNYWQLENFAECAFGFANAPAPHTPLLKIFDFQSLRQFSRTYGLARCRSTSP